MMITKYEFRGEKDGISLLILAACLKQEDIFSIRLSRISGKRNSMGDADRKSVV